ncbi:MAG: hypothetical protein QOG01_1701 [Pseudonocardiales bacterium]|nr:hypothetical protein [Pseudonocardiales bacterium]
MFVDEFTGSEHVVLAAPPEVRATLAGLASCLGAERVVDR